MRTGFGICLIALLGTSACYNPRFTSPPDGNAGFLCFGSDSPSCPTGLVCCVDKRNGPLCGEELAQKEPTTEGRCMAPPPPAMPTPWKDWDLGTKTTVVAATGDPMLTGLDPDSMQWRCPRDDGNPMPAKEIALKLEPNDTMEKAINAGSLALDNIPPNLSAYEICPDKNGPTVPDVDVFKFRLSTQAKVIVEVKYQVTFGDLDVGLFREGLNENNEKIPQRIMQDVTAVNDACVVANSLAGGTYYVAVRGSPSQAGDYNAGMSYAMNNYRIRLYALSPGAAGSCASPVADMR